MFHPLSFRRCGNVAAILELDEHLNKDFTIFEAAPQVSNSCLLKTQTNEDDQNVMPSESTFYAT